jgi:Arc/MetJ family transcription regulator
MAPMPYFGRTMKMTMHIDEKVLARVIKITGAKTKTAAVKIALNEMARRHKAKKLFARGLGLTPDELKAAIYPDYDPDDLSTFGWRPGKTSSPHKKEARAVAEAVAPYGKSVPA